MQVYVLGLLISEIIIWLGYRIFKQNKIIIFFFATLPFILISGFRYFVGTDFKLYYGAFYYIKEFGYYEYWELGYNMLNKAILLFSDNSVALFVTVATIITLFTFFSIYQMSINPAQSILIWVISLCYFESMNTMRQSLALSLFFLAFVFALKKNKIGFVIFILLATSMHLSAIILLPTYYLVNMNMSFKQQVIIAGLSATCSPFLLKLVDKIPIFTKYIRYLSGNLDFRLMDCVISVMSWLLAWYLKPYVKEERKQTFNFLLNLQFIYMILSILSGNIPLAYRVILYFAYTSIFLFPEIINASAYRSNRIVLRIFLYGAYLVQWYVYAQVIGIVDYIKYNSIWG